MNTFVNGEEPDEMQHNALHEGLHCLFVKGLKIFRQKNPHILDMYNGLS